MVLLVRKSQIAVKQESVEGTAESLAAADAGMLVYDPVFTPDFEQFARNPARSTLGQLGFITGKRSATISWKTELKGSGATGTAPAWAVAVRASGFTVNVVSALSAGTIDGTLLPGELLTGTTNSVTMRVVGEWSGAAQLINVVPVSGTIGAADRMVAASGASFTSADVAVADQGFEYRPISSNVPTVTVGFYMDGLKKTIRGARGTFTIEGLVGEPVTLNFTFSGVYDNVVDAALLSGIDFEDNDPIAFLDANATIGTASACFTSANIEVANDVVQRECANNASGIISYFITNRAPTLSLDPEMELVATNDFYGDLLANTDVRFYFELPSSSAGQKVVVGCPRGQYTGVGESDRDGLAVADLDVALVSADVDSGDDEIQIAQI